MSIRGHSPYTGPKPEPFSHLAKRGSAPEGMGHWGTVSPAMMSRLCFSGQSMLMALSFVLVLSLPIVSAQATSIHHDHADCGEASHFHPPTVVPTQATSAHNDHANCGEASHFHPPTGDLVGGPLPADFTVAPTNPGNYGSGAEVTWSLMPTNQNPGSVFNFFHEGGISHLSAFMGGQWKAEIERAFAAWSDVANITFREVSDDNASVNAFTTGGDIRIGGAVFDGPGNLLGHGWFPDSTNGGSLAGDIHFDIAEDWTIGFTGPGFDIFTVAAHEIGHAIGLDHTTVPGSLMNFSYTEAFSGLQADDILGAQSIYGAAPLSFSVVVLPEPDTVVLLATGLIGLAAGRRKRTVTTQ
jgi:hypothetical protein